jgi:transcription elongation GreA/GreB family factor
MSEIASVVTEFNSCVENADFEKAFSILRANLEDISKKLQSSAIGEALKKSTSDRTLLSFIDSVGFGQSSLDDSMHKLEKLLQVKEGTLVLAKNWGLGEVKRVDYFYRRITVDFKMKRGHQYTYDVAAENLEFPGENHILVIAKSDPDRVADLLKNNQGEFVKMMLKSYGDMPLLKLEKLVIENGFVKSANWKKFWESARAELKKDRYVEIPVKKTEPIILKTVAEDYGETWLMAFEHETEPNKILADVREYVACGKFASAGDDVKEKLADRLQFALVAASMSDEALYARLACLVAELKFARPSTESMRAHLWERHRYVKAAQQLPSREVGAMFGFLAASEDEKLKLYRSIPDFSFSATAEIVNLFGAEDMCRQAIGEFLRVPKAPATLVTYIIGKYEQFENWSQLPSLLVILNHAIAIGEGRQGGEALRMQNIIRRLFADKKWLEKMLGSLSDGDKIIFFERFQSSPTWDHSTHHTIVVRMTNFVPSLKERLVKVEKKQELPRVTSFRSYAVRKAEYLKLINKDMPENIKKIEFAKGFGDLSENAEYQYAKDEQRQLMQKQAVMQSELDAVKPSDFADVSVDVVNPGVTVVVEFPNKDVKTFTVLGEWDNDIDLGILSFKTKVAQNMLGKKAGDGFEIPSQNGSSEQCKIIEIKPVSEEIRKWMQIPEGLSI